MNIIEIQDRANDFNVFAIRKCDFVMYIVIHSHLTTISLVIITIYIKEEDIG